MLQLGWKEIWPTAISKLTGRYRIETVALMEYFQPLLDFLKKENGEDYGWEENCPKEPPHCNARRLETPISTVGLFVAIGVAVGRLGLRVVLV